MLTESCSGSVETSVVARGIGSLCAHTTCMQAARLARYSAQAARAACARVRGVGGEAAGGSRPLARLSARLTRCETQGVRQWSPALEARTRRAT